MMPRRAFTSERSAFPRVAPARPRTVSRANPPFSRQLPPHVRANARFYWENRRQYGNPASSGSVVANDPLNRLDFTGLDSYEVARPLDSAAGAVADHMFIVTNAKSLGDPKATVISFGKLDNGNMGNVSPGHDPAPISANTATSDQKAWVSLGSKGSSSAYSRIDAPDKVVAATAAAVKEDKPYSITPGLTSGSVNSNSAATAVSNRSTEISGGNQTPNPTYKLTPGAAESGRVDFKPINVCGSGGNQACK